MVRKTTDQEAAAMQKAQATAAVHKLTRRIGAARADKHAPDNSGYIYFLDSSRRDVMLFSGGGQS